jgi:hypothetical protein
MPDFRPDMPKGFDQNRCWRNRSSSGGTLQGRCTNSVDPKDALGLCETHIDELKDTNEEICTEELDILAIVC